MEGVNKYEERQEWLEETRQTVEEYFPGGN
jgi:hypothetical protein